MSPPTQVRKQAFGSSNASLPRAALRRRHGFALWRHSPACFRPPSSTTPRALERLVGYPRLKLRQAARGRPGERLRNLRFLMTANPQAGVVTQIPQRGGRIGNGVVLPSSALADEQQSLLRLLGGRSSQSGQSGQDHSGKPHGRHAQNVHTKDLRSGHLRTGGCCPQPAAAPPTVPRCTPQRRPQARPMATRKAPRN